jgi:hypothetical protein
LVGGEVGAVAAGLLVAREQDDDLAARLEALGAQAEQSGGDRGHALFVVHRAAPVEIAVRFAEREGIARPILAARLDHVHMRHEQDRLALRRPRRRPAQDQGGGLVIGMDGGAGEAAGAELLLEIGRELRARIAALDGLQRDRMGIDFAGLDVPAVGGRRVGGGLGRSGADGGAGEEAGKESMTHRLVPVKI